ncbi:MAG: dihydroorotate dehydrogenase-like protein [Bacteroidota bacterium]
MNLKTTYLGIELKNPIVPSASPLSRTIHSLRSMEDFGASAVVLYSLFEEQIRHEMREIDFHLTQHSHSNAEAMSYFPDSDDYYIGPDQYLEHIRDAKRALEIPVIGSLNGSTLGGWVKYASEIQEAGADALELNIYYIPTDINISSSDVEKRYVEILKSVKKEITIPIAVKISPYFSSTANFAKQLVEAGANGLVLFNRFYQPDIDLESLQVEPSVRLSTSFSTRTPLRWIAILHNKLNIDLAASTGVHTAEDVLKLIAAGANITMLCSALLKNGVGHISDVLTNVNRWLIDHEYESLNQLRGSMSYKTVADPSSFERAHYMKALQSYM